MKNLSVVLALASLLVFSCKKEKEEPVPATDNSSETGSMEIHFDAMVGNSDLVIGNTYTTASNENYKVSTFKYFISNIKLKKTDGTEYVVPQDQSYFLINESIDSTQHVILSNIPAGDYNSITFMVGIDSLRNTKPVGERTGVLDIAGNASGMYWSWNSGYIFMKLEGNYGPNLDSSFKYHIGLFGGYSTPTINNTRWVTTTSTSKAQVRKNNTPEVHMHVDVAKIFDGTNTMSIEANPVIMASPISAKIADNYKDMFKIHHIHN